MFLRRNTVGMFPTSRTETSRPRRPAYVLLLKSPFGGSFKQTRADSWHGGEGDATSFFRLRETSDSGEGNPSSPREWESGEGPRGRSEPHPGAQTAPRQPTCARGHQRSAGPRVHRGTRRSIANRRIEPASRFRTVETHPGKISDLLGRRQRARA